MATSGSTDYSQTRDDIIKRALRLIGALAQGESPTTDQVTEAAVALNGLVKAWEADGMPLWAIKERTITLQATTNTYTLTTPKPLKVIQAWYRNVTSSVDVPMRVITREEYNRLGNKSSTGTSPVGWRYTVSGTTGTWEPFGSSQITASFTFDPPAITAAALAGVELFQLYRTGSTVKIRTV